jgi:hypothetical protein
MTITITPPTRQRIARATTPPVVDDAGNVLVAANDNFTVDPVTRAYHLKDSPIERLAGQGKITAIQKQAAERFFADYYNAGLAPLGAVDYGKAMVDGTTPQSGSDFRFAAADRYRAATKILSAGVLKVVDRVVLREMSVELAGRDATGFQNAPQARAAGMFALMEGLDVLAKHYGLVA